MEWYRIKQVAERTGLSEQLIRKWEQRYGAVEPRRLENGYRMYSSEDVSRLRAIKEIVDSGTSVSQAVESIRQLPLSDHIGDNERDNAPRAGVRLVDEEKVRANTGDPARDNAVRPVEPVERVTHEVKVGDNAREKIRDNAVGPIARQINEEQPQQANAPISGIQPALPLQPGLAIQPGLPLQPAGPSEWVNMLIVAGTEGRIRDIKQILHRCYVMNGFRTMVSDVIVPFLHIVGVLWEEASWSEDQEHLSSLCVRDFLVQRMVDLPDAPEGAPMLLTSCIPGERHDIMLNIAMLEAKRLGFATAFLGTDPAPGAIERAVARLHPTVLLLSATSDRQLVGHPEHQQWLLRLDNFAASLPNTRFCLGGPKSIVELYTKGLSHVSAVESLPHLFSELEAISGVKVS